MEKTRTDKQSTSESSIDSRQRVLDVAEKLYMQHGYRAVSLRDIANALAIKQASLYYHFPDGKEQLFVEVVERALRRHQAGLEHSLANREAPLRAHLHAIFDWFSSQPPMNLMAMVHADIPALQPERARLLERATYNALFQPLIALFDRVKQRGEIRIVDSALLAGTILTLINGLNYSIRHAGEDARPMMQAQLVDILLEGLHPRG